MPKALVLVGAFAYLVLPIDLLPEVLLGPIGLLDDLGVLALAAKYVMKATPEQARLPARPRRECGPDDDLDDRPRRPEPARPLPPRALPVRAVSAGDVARSAADAAVRPLADSLPADQVDLVRRAVEEEVRKSLRRAA